ncbi:MAG: response regulator transcription factor [Muribaculaceae bacterium]
MTYRVAIIMRNTLDALGIKYILEEAFSISPQVFSALGQVPDVGSDLFDFYFTSPELFVKHLDFFLPRRQKVITVTSSPRDDEANVLCANDDESTIIDSINAWFANIERNAADHQDELSQREIDVLRLIASGMINKEIAESLGISINTVLTHRKNITNKLGIRSVSGLTFYAMMNGIIAPK